MSLDKFLSDLRKSIDDSSVVDDLARDARQQYSFLKRHAKHNDGTGGKLPSRLPPHEQYIRKYVTSHLTMMGYDPENPNGPPLDPREATAALVDPCEETGNLTDHVPKA